MTLEKRNLMIAKFKSIVLSGLSKTAALDMIVNEYKQYNQAFIRSTFKSAAGWYY